MKITASHLVHPKLNTIFRWVNGKLDQKSIEEAKQQGYSDPLINFFTKTNGLLLKATKTIWPLFLPLQIFGLFNDKFLKLAKAWYGACWSIVYSCYRPWKEDREKLPETDPHTKEEVNSLAQTAFNVNEHFRVGMGTLVSALYGGGAFGMLWNALTGNDEAFDKSAEVYKTGMFNQNQIFGSMNAAIVLKRFLFKDKSLPPLENNNHLKEVDKDGSDLKAIAETVDTALFIPNIIGRGLDTFKLFGMQLGDGTQRFINTLNYLCYGDWAFRFGDVKTRKEEGGDLEPLNENLTDTGKKIDKFLHDTQKYSGNAFRWVLSAFSWSSAGLEMLGHSELAEKVFKWEGIFERLHPTILAWCVRNPVLSYFFKKTEEKAENNQQAIQEKAKEKIKIHKQTATQIDEKKQLDTIGKVPELKVIRRNGDRIPVKTNLNTASPSIVVLAEKYRVSSVRLLEAIKYQVGIQDFKPPTREQIEQPEPNYPANDFAVVANELDLPIWLVRHAIKTEQYSGGNGNYDSALQRARAEAVA